VLRLLQLTDELPQGAGIDGPALRWLADTRERTALGTNNVTVARALVAN
jgi:hypothetical protein